MVESSINNTLLDFDVTAINGITFWRNLLAVLTPNAIVLFEFASETLDPGKSSHEVGRIYLSTSVDLDLLEFKFFNQSSVFFCDPFTCRLCSLKSDQSCTLYSLKTKGRSNGHLLQVSATYTSDGGIALRYINDDGEAALLKYASTSTSERRIEPSQYADDIPIITEHHVVCAFNREGFSYFVGSARRPFEPLINSKIDEEAILTSVRITRICDKDATKNLESRIEIALGCPHIGLYEDVYTTAAEYDEESDRLTVALQSPSDSPTKSDSLCSFNMLEISNAFESVWNDCQNTTFSASAEECYYATDAESLPKHCFIFTRLADGHAMTPCSRFGGNYQAPRPDNCELNKFKSLAYRYGWLEEFNPFNGSLYAMLPDNLGEVVSLGHAQGDNAVFALSADGQFKRIGHDPLSKSNSPLWSTRLLSKSKYSFAIDSKRSKIYYIEHHRIKYVEVSCAGLYKNCDALERASWSDPLGCRWCGKSNGSGKTLSPAEQCSDVAVIGTCPPYIEHVNPVPASRDSTLFEIYGDKFDRLHGLSISACNHTCPAKSVEHNKLTCVLSMPFDNARDCAISAEGELNKNGRFTVSYLRSTFGTTIDSASTRGHRSTSTRTLKAIASMIAVVTLVVLIALIILLVRRYQARQRIRRKHTDATSSQVPFEAINGSIFGHASAESNAYIGHNGSDYPLRRFNPYERLFLEIDPKLKIPLDELNIGDEIGKGNFGVVYKGTLRDSSGVAREVACKTIDSHNDGVVSGVSEFLREGLIMANFNHPNVAQLIGISLTKSNCPLIVTDYLANGDLRHYIINPNNRLTFGNLLDFGIQIAEGMAYLHDKKFIHRDLAARNCMLDADLRVKIADFGLSRDVSRCGMYEAVNKDRGIPIRWMPIESLEDQQYTFKGDVWAYGVVLWELATRGLIPYADLEMYEILRLLKNGHRLSKPKGCPDILYERVMLVCWMEDPKRRPTFYELKEMMQDVVSQLRKGVSGNGLLNNHYERVSPRSVATTPIAYTKPVAGPIITDL
ncbi:Hepatocyte growth factor receptor [Toxocara canis]|uniref:Hepatocyte growth factor receptor n=1 Tax=Toxocara canis TaxID=6265 RepID=A0A0B2W404_TOXCA|nr:Hepatocyte growth factor receptor [Toxocara canis]